MQLASLHDEEAIEIVSWLPDLLPLSFTMEHCLAARELLHWSVDTLAHKSGVTSGAIQRLEDGQELNEVSMQALAYALEEEGLVFFPGHLPMIGDNCRGSTKDPRSRHDYHLLE